MWDTKGASNMELDRLKQQITAQLGRIVPSLVKYKYALIVLLVGILLLYACLLYTSDAADD